MAEPAEKGEGAKTAVEIDIRKTARENASAYFERAKKIREKIARTRAHLKEASEKLLAEKPEKEKKSEKRREEWYEEKYRFFISSEGNLVIGGKDAQTNESAIKKHTGKEDTVFHADPAGSPFVVIRGKCSERTLSEAASFCASYSRAWQARLGSVDVYWVSPEQVKKTALAGEYVPKGAFMIYGKKNYFKNTVLELGIFLDSDGIPRAAPLAACPDKRVDVAPGGTERKDAIKEIKKLLGFGGKDDAIDRLLPPGKCIVRKRQGAGAEG